MGDLDVLTAPAMQEKAKRVEENLIPLKSRKKYMKAYDEFKSYQRNQGTTRISERVMLCYFEDISESMKPSSLWSIYSRLKCTIGLNEKIDIGEFGLITKLLNQQMEGYEPKSAKPLSEDDVKNFILLAPDKLYLATKVILIFGLMGALRMGEMIKIMTTDVERHGDVLLVKIPTTNTKNKKKKSFVISGEYLKLVDRYMALRPKNLKTDRFFLNYKDEKCTSMPIGIGNLRKMPKMIAEYLSLPNPGEYTGHSFRRTSTSILANAGANSETIRLHGGWTSNTAPNRYIEESIQHKANTADIILSAVGQNSTRTSTRSSTEPFVHSPSACTCTKRTVYSSASARTRKSTKVKPFVHSARTCTKPSTSTKEPIVHSALSASVRTSTSTTPIEHSPSVQISNDKEYEYVEEIPYFTLNQHETEDTEMVPILTPNGSEVTIDSISVEDIEDEYKLTQSQVQSQVTVISGDMLPKRKKFRYKTPVIYKFNNCSNVTINH